MVDREGAPPGRIAHIYLDRVTEEPQWALVATGRGGRQLFVPLVDAASAPAAGSSRGRLLLAAGYVLGARAGRGLTAGSGPAPEATPARR